MTQRRSRDREGKKVSVKKEEKGLSEKLERSNSVSSVKTPRKFRV